MRSNTLTRVSNNPGAVQKKKLAAIKRALLADKSHAHILATKFGIQKA